MARLVLVAAALSLLLAIQVAAKDDGPSTSTFNYNGVPVKVFANEISLGTFKDLASGTPGKLSGALSGSGIAFGGACDPNGPLNGNVCAMGCSATFKTCPWDCDALPSGSDSQVAYRVFFGNTAKTVCYPKSKENGLCTNDKFCADGLKCSDPIDPKIGCKDKDECDDYPGGRCAGLPSKWNIFKKYKGYCSIGRCTK